jgi:23S rRNA (adenine2503-C2)-methyltransferase
MGAVKNYIRRSGRRVTFEWALINEKNDTPEQAHALGMLLQGTLCHVNMIPLNPTHGYNGKPSDPARIREFQRILGLYNVTSTVRLRRGIDIQAGCGQLKAEAIRGGETVTVKHVL